MPRKQLDVTVRPLSTVDYTSVEKPVSCASCSVPTEDKSNHSAAGTIHPQRSATCVLYETALSDSPSQK